MAPERRGTYMLYIDSVIRQFWKD